MTKPELDAAVIIGVLNRCAVDYVVIGAFASQLYDAPISATFDIDFTPSRTRDNLRRLDDALHELDAKIRKKCPLRITFWPRCRIYSSCQYPESDVSLWRL